MTRARLVDAVRTLAIIEMRNALALSGEPGFAGRGLLRPDDQLAVIRALDAQVAGEIAARYAEKRIARFDALARAWPETRRRLVQEGFDADLADIAAAVKGNGFAFGRGRGSSKAPRTEGAAPEGEDLMATA